MSTAERVVILGATGDLTGRYLLPALAELADAGRLPSAAVIHGMARDPWDTAGFRRHASQRLARHTPEIPAPARRAVVDRLEYSAGDVTDPAALATAIGDGPGAVLCYLALPPAVYPATVRGLSAIELVAGSRVVVEKPFGTDRASATALNALLRECFAESSVFRIDHVLGQQTVQNLLGVRFANRLFESGWDREHVESVDVVWDETIALEGRAGYYDHAGALRDMVQSHLLQLLCLVAMEEPTALDERHFRDRKMELLRAVRAAEPGDDLPGPVRARYQAGRVHGHEIPAYADEPGVDPDRETETFTSVTMLIENERWRGVPFRLRTGKALGRDRRFIRVTFREVTWRAFDRDEAPPNALTFHMDPDRLTLALALNGAGDPFRLEPAELGPDLAPQALSAYARLLLDALEGDVTLSIRGDEAEESWRIVEPILTSWARDEAALLEYPAGSAGPVA